MGTVGVVVILSLAGLALAMTLIMSVRGSARIYVHGASVS